jgi:NADPH-dependent curcumin reductase CurA
VSPRWNRKWIYHQRPAGEVGPANYRLVEGPLEQTLAAGDLLVRARYISVDPYMRIGQSAQRTWDDPHPIGEVQGAGVVGQVEESRDPSGTFRPGDWVSCYTGWQLYGVCPAAEAQRLDPALAPVTTALGVLGMPGRTAYFGLLDAARPQAGETVVVSGAAGAVGSIVVQLAKLRGCRVVGIVGSAEKTAYLTGPLGVDAAVNYKEHPTAAQMTEALQRVCPSGVDVYFDNVGGIITDALWPVINLRARVIICGQISQYSGKLDEPELGPRFLHRILYTRARIQGILARDYKDRMPEMLAVMGPWVLEGRVKYIETLIEGFDRLPAALNGLFHGANTGKMIVKV